MLYVGIYMIGESLYLTISQIPNFSLMWATIHFKIKFVTYQTAKAGQVSED